MASQTNSIKHLERANAYPQRRQWQLTPVLLPGKSHGRRGLVGCSPWGRQESDTTKQLHFHFSLSFIGEGNGNPLQCSCLENPRDGGAWWAAVYGVAQSRTQLKRLSSSSNAYPSKPLSKNCRGRNISKFILGGHHHSDTKTRQRQHKKRKLQTNITDDHRYKNPQQNFSKQNSAIHQKAHTT